MYLTVCLWLWCIWDNITSITKSLAFSLILPWQTRDLIYFLFSPLRPRKFFLFTILSFKLKKKKKYFCYQVCTDIPPNQHFVLGKLNIVKMNSDSFCCLAFHCKWCQAWKGKLELSQLAKLSPLTSCVWGSRIKSTPPLQTLVLLRPTGVVIQIQTGNGTPKFN